MIKENALKEIDLQQQQELTELFQRITKERLKELANKINQNEKDYQLSNQEISLITIISFLQYPRHSQLTDSMISTTNNYIKDLILRIRTRETNSEVNNEKSEHLARELIVLSTLPLLTKQTIHYTSNGNYNKEIINRTL